MNDTSLADVTVDPASREPRADCPPSRRIPRLLRPAWSVLWIVLAIAAGSAAYAYKYVSNRAETIRWIENAGGTVSPPYRRKWFPAWLKIPERARAFDEIGAIYLEQGDRFDLRRLADFPELNNLVLKKTPIDYHPTLRTLRNLHFVVLLEADATDDVIADLRGCRQLEYLTLRGTRITDRAIEHLRDFPLKQLDLSGTSVTDAGVSKLVGLPLTYIVLSDTRVTDAGVAQLESLALHRLDLDGTQVTDAVVPVLLRMRLQTVGLRGTKLTALGLARLREHPTLLEVFD